MEIEKKILILFAHPALHKSRVNKVLLNHIQHLEGVTIQNLYEEYPDFHINIKREQNLLLQHDIIIWHHPFYWYSAPSIIKEWIDLVLEHGFAYGKEGIHLKGKEVISVISTGGREQTYRKEGFHHYSIHQFLIPFKQTVELCNMRYLPPFVVHGSHELKRKEIEEYAGKYKNLLVALNKGIFTQKEINKSYYLNELIS